LTLNTGPSFLKLRRRQTQHEHRPTRGRRFVVPKSYEIAPLDLSVAQVAELRSESRSTVLRKLKTGRYRSYLSGGKRKIIAASVYADRELEMKAGKPVRPQPIPVTRPGRPRKHPKPGTATASATE
jgi:hypothetical protein